MIYYNTETAYHSSLLVLKISFCQYLVWLIATPSLLSPNDNPSLHAIIPYTVQRTGILSGYFSRIFLASVCLSSTRKQYNVMYALPWRPETLLY